MSDEDVNFVDRQVNREDALREGPPEIWIALLCAIDHAVQSFEKRCCDANFGPAVECASNNENSRTVKITRTPESTRQQYTATVNILFDAQGLNIVGRTTDRTQKVPEVLLRIDADETGKVFLVHKGQPVTLNQAVELLLRPIMFPEALKARKRI